MTSEPEQLEPLDKTKDPKAGEIGDNREPTDPIDPKQETSSNATPSDPSTEPEQTLMNTIKKKNPLSKLRSFANYSTYERCVIAYNDLCEHHQRNNLQKHQLFYVIEDIDKGLDLLESLLTEKDTFNSKLKEQQQTITELQSAYNKQKQDATDWYNDYTDLTRKNADLKTENQNQKSQLQTREASRKSLDKEYSVKLQQLKDTYGKQVSDLQHQVDVLQEQVRQFGTDREKFEAKRDELESSRSALLAELAGYRLNKGSNHVAGDRPQNYALALEYKSLIEQYLDNAASSLLPQLIKRDSEKWAGDRKRKLHSVKAIFSREVLIKGQAIISGEDNILPEPDSSLLDEIQNLMQQKVGISADSPHIAEFKCQVNKILSLGLRFSQGKTQYPQAGTWQEADFANATQEIKASLIKAFDLNQQDLENELITKLELAIHESLKFLEKVALADPPGKLCPETEGAKYDAKIHKLAKTSPEDGVVVETAYPFYIDPSYTQHKTVRVQAEVWVEPQSEGTIDSTGSQSPETKTSETKSGEEVVKNETQESPTQKNENDIKISSLKDTLISNLSVKKFSEQHPTFPSPDGIHSDELEIRESIKKQILAITNAKTLLDLNAFLINKANSLIAFQTEINRVTSSSPNN